MQPKMFKPDPKYYISGSFGQLQDIPEEMLFNTQSFTLKFIHSFSEIPYTSEHIESFIKVNQERFRTQMESIAFNSQPKVIPIHETRKSIEQDNSTSVNTEEISTNKEVSIINCTEKKVGCNCKKTGCLKMYCQCFSSGKICTKQCNCCNCCNHQKSLDKVQKAKLLFNQKINRSTFDPINCNIKKKCTCKKSQCQKKYCECYNAGQACSEICKCEDCLNGTHTKQQHLRQKLEKKIIF